MTDGGERWLRPSTWVALRICANTFGLFWLYISILCVVSAWIDGDSYIPVHKLVSSWAMCGVGFAAVFGMSWLWARRVAWRVGPEGIAVYRGDKLRWSFAWAEVVSLDVGRAVVIVRLAGPPRKQRLPWAEEEGAWWLREYARERLGGDRLDTMGDLIGPGDTLPARVARILLANDSQYRFYLAPSIPPNKLANATAKACVPVDEKVLGLIDCTIFGSASDCLIFGSRGFYYHNSLGGSNPNPGSIEYSEFPRCQFRTSGLWSIRLDEHRYFGQAGSSLSRRKVIAILTAIKQAVQELAGQGVGSAEVNCG
jgi:hypothetical protein